MRKKRKNLDLRSIKISKDFMEHALASCLIEQGKTRVICSVTLEESVPRWLKGKGRGWVTAEYSMLPTATHTRTDREAIKGRLSGRTQEIQRLIGRSIRNVFSLELLGERVLKIDCDVISADGGTRTASINGAWVATRIAVNKLLKNGIIKSNPMKKGVSAISCGIIAGTVLLDLDYSEDSNADADANFVFNSEGKIIEIQCTGEKEAISNSQFSEMFKASKLSCSKIYKTQLSCING
ncbi:MAG: Ribonuclease PH [Alphaproteobacteria bacterium MarineAlpha9_Bin4]|nr:ribonuclease PH [Pelagibacterales bacterium]PPR25578.1 MAG: Ribonuclease PH [Alphaproteobacteria bacterium MarineAlpha9_Bin4]|tara:strand:- start:897 stop:1610 length:714 start_codon:yes stop_codon:yes gene_type:complete